MPPGAQLMRKHSPFFKLPGLGKASGRAYDKFSSKGNSEGKMKSPSRGGEKTSKDSSSRARRY